MIVLCCTVLIFIFRLCGQVNHDVYYAISWLALATPCTHNLYIKTGAVRCRPLLRAFKFTFKTRFNTRAHHTFHFPNRFSTLAISNLFSHSKTARGQTIGVTLSHIYTKNFQKFLRELYVRGPSVRVGTKIFTDSVDPANDGPFGEEVENVQKVIRYYIYILTC